MSEVQAVPAARMNLNTHELRVGDIVHEHIYDALTLDDSPDGTARELAHDYVRQLLRLNA